MSQPWPTELRVRKGGGAVLASFDDGQSFELPSGLLRAMTPSADGRGHGKTEFAPLKVPVAGVTVSDMRPVGRYAVKLTFSDGHDTGLYTWDRLYRIGAERAQLEALL